MDVPDWQELLPPNEFQDLLTLAEAAAVPAVRFEYDYDTNLPPMHCYLLVVNY